MRLLGACVAIALAAAAGCTGTAPALPDFEDVTRVVVTGLGGEKVATVTDAGRVEAIVLFANARNHGWESPWAGVPVPAFGATFYSGERCAGSFGAGPGFFETQRAGSFYSHDAATEDVDEFARLLGVPPLRRR